MVNHIPVLFFNKKATEYFLLPFIFQTYLYFYCMIWTEMLGYTAAFLTTTSFIPQAYKIYQTKNTQAISLSMFLIFNLGLVCWLIFGIVIHSLPVILANSITLILAMYILLIKIKNIMSEK